MKKKSSIAAVITLVCVLAMACATGCVNSQDKNKDKDPRQDTESKLPKPNPYAMHKPVMWDFEAPCEKPAEKAEDPYKNTVDFDKYRKINPDVYAWIKVPNTAIDYPILQSVSQANDYYLMRTIDLYVGYPGAIYTEKRNSQDFMDPVTVIYGHDMLNGSMFANLHKYRSSEFFAKNPYFYIYLPDKTLKYRIFSAVAFNDRHILKAYDFKNKKGELLRFYNDLMSRNTGNKDNTVPVKGGSRIVTLSTCIGPHPDQRWLVSGTLYSIEKKSEDN